MQGWNPNYIEYNQIKASRINLIAVLLNKNNTALTLDDGSGKIECRIFNETKNDEYKPGDTVLIIARPREYNNNKYLVPEIIKKTNKKWLLYRKKELETIDYGSIKEQQSIEIKEETTNNNSLTILEKLKELDKGEGVPIENLLEKLNVPEADKHINLLLNEGEIFEIKPGILKLLT